MEVARMTLKKWTTKSDQLREFLQQEQSAATKGMVVLQESPLKVLGLTWDPATDTFSFALTNLMNFLKSSTNTKRFVLQTAWRGFDTGGLWECLVRTVKTTLRKILGKALLTFKELGTVLTEVEAVVNSRALTFIESDIGEPCALMPTDLLIGRGITALPHGIKCRHRFNAH
ncbi:hypothetical protein HPB48_022602 [Haemaphysalis longicornis]|uniref:Uncharacterized protein n=1 Tax=Haemaphysalis longicornis TaxID=44386 RepID=A0A9J6GUF5_HAELO|nr:hypothetical protein HPB48_022602 [Haemaphysalis longicornis]